MKINLTLYLYRINTFQLVVLHWWKGSSLADNRTNSSN